MLYVHSFFHQVFKQVRFGSGIRCRFSVNFLPLLSDKIASKFALTELYKQRWYVELDLRNIKTVLGMDVLYCKTPLMNKKEMWVYFLAYNILRCLIACESRYSATTHQLQTYIANRVGMISSTCCARCQ